MIFIFLLKNCVNVKKIRIKFLKKNVFFIDGMLRFLDKCEYNIWIIFEGIILINNKRMVRYGIVSFVCSLRLERSIWSFKDGIFCKFR